MATTSTLKAIADELVEETGLGFVLPSFTGTTTTLTLTTAGAAEIRGPFSGKKIPIGSPVLITAGGTPGDDTYVSDWNPSTGVLTVDPAITTGATDGVVITSREVESGIRLLKAIDRAAKNRLTRWQKTPLTFVADGDLQGATVTDYWTAAANGTAAYATAQTFPAGSAADVVSSATFNRVLQLTSAGGATSVAGNGIRVVRTAQQRGWYFLTAIRLVSGAGTVTFSIYDKTNSADITPQVSRGNDANTLTVTTPGDFMVCEGTVQQPATCDKLAPKLSLSATGMVAQMAPVILFPLDAVTFPVPNRILSDSYIGNFYYAVPLSGPGGVGSIAFSEPLTTGGSTHHIESFGDHLTVTFNFRPVRAVYFDEAAGENSLASLTDTTAFPLDHIVKWAKFELYKTLYQRENGRRQRTDTSVPVPSVWRTAAREALREAQRSDYEPETLQVYGRV